MLRPTGTTYNAEEKIWSGPITKDIYSSEMTMGEAIAIQLLKTPRKIIQIMGSTGETLTAQEFLQHSTTLASNMLKLGIKSQDVVGLYANHSLHLATVVMASFLCGTPVNGVFYEFDKDTIETLFKNTRPKIIFCEEKNYQNARSANENLQLEAKIILMTGSVKGVTTLNELLVRHEDKLWNISDFPCAKLNNSHTAVILCSSGTTGTPKGVMCSHHALLHNTIYFTATSDSVLLCFSTMYWGSGLLNLTSSLLNSNLRIIPEEAYIGDYFIDLVKRYKITHIFATGTQLTELVLNYSTAELRQSLQSVDTLLCGGAKVPKLVQEKFLEILPDNTRGPGLSIIYGMSEMSGGVSCNGGYPLDFQIQSEGKLWSNRKVCIIDKNGQRLGPNETGELLVCSSYTWLGYYNNPEATAKALDGKWLYSGDLGYFDNLGFLHVMGRDKDMFKWKNFQICPQPIEDVILRMPGVAEVCVFPIPDLVAGNLAACAIVKTKGDDGLKLTADAVNQYLERKMDSYYHMKGGVYFVDILPKTPSGKMQRQKVTELICAKREHLKIDK